MASDKKNPANPEFPDAPTGEVWRRGTFTNPNELFTITVEGFWFAVFDNCGIELIQILKVCLNISLPQLDNKVPLTLRQPCSIVKTISPEPRIDSALLLQ